MSSLAVIAGISASVVVTSFISGILGMAGGMILMGVLLALLPVPTAMMLHGVTQFASNIWRALLWRREIDWRVFRGNAIGALLVVAVFFAMQFVVSRGTAYLILGITPFIGLMLPARLELNVDRPWHSFGCGVISTSLSLASGVSGPLLDVFFMNASMSRRGIVATKAASQTLVHLMKSVYFGSLLASAESDLAWWFGLVMAALAIVGTSLSRRALEHMSEHNFRTWTRWTISSIGLFYLCNGLWFYTQR